MRANGSERGGKPFSRGHIYGLLANPIYTGQIARKGELYPGLHSALTDNETWTAVRNQLAATPSNHRHRAKIRVLLLRNLVRLNHLLPMLDLDGTNISHSIKLRSFSTQSEIRRQWPHFARRHVVVNHLSRQAIAGSGVIGQNRSYDGRAYSVRADASAPHLTASPCNRIQPPIRGAGF
jgi:Recombinase